MNDFETRLQGALVRGIPGKSGGIVDAAWLDPAELAGPDWKYRNRTGSVAGLILGYRNDEGIGCMDNRHVLTVAGSRGGKGVSLIVPNLLMYDGSASRSIRKASWPPLPHGHAVRRARRSSYSTHSRPAVAMGSAASIHLINSTPRVARCRTMWR